MAEEFEGGVSCGENWWNLPNNNNKNFFGGGSSLLGSTNDVAASFDWPPPSHGTTTTVILPNKRSTHHDSPGFSSSDDNNNSNQDFFAKSEDNYSNNNFGGDYYLNNNNNNNNNNPGDYPLQQQQHQVIPVLGSASYDYTSSLLQTLFETDDEPDHHHINSNPPNTINHNYSNNYDQFLHNTTTHLPATWTNDFLPPPQSQSLLKNKNEGGKKEPAMKRARIQAPSPLPTFKVRKEKLGDRVTALQQLVSPFGKTDTASVLHEAIEYIKYLHDQVSVFSSPYLKNKSHPLQQHLHGGGDEKVVKKDVLKSRGLCLVPISSTFPVSAEITTDFWTPIFGVDSFN